jgi:hypothetical protein
MPNGSSSRPLVDRLAVVCTGLSVFCFIVSLLLPWHWSEEDGMLVGMDLFIVSILNTGESKWFVIVAAANGILVLSAWLLLKRCFQRLLVFRAVAVTVAALAASTATFPASGAVDETADYFTGYFMWLAAFVFSAAAHGLFVSLTRTSSPVSGIRR